MVSTLTALRRDHDKATQLILERVVPLERVAQKLKVHDEKIRAKLDPVLQADGGHSNAGALEAAKAKGKPQKAVRFEVEGITSPRPSNMKADLFAINTAEIGNPEGDGGGQASEYQDLGWWENLPDLAAPSNLGNTIHHQHCHLRFPSLEVAAQAHIVTGSFSNSFRRLRSL